MLPKKYKQKAINILLVVYLTSITQKYKSINKNKRKLKEFRQTALNIKDTDFIDLSFHFRNILQLLGCQYNS